MLIHNSDTFLLYFGDTHNGVTIEEYKQAYSSKGVTIPEECVSLTNSFALQECIFLRQTHSINGLVIPEKHNLELVPFVHDGDFLITNKTNLGIGILTADCLPIILYDQVNNVIAIAHAGWRGSLEGIAETVVLAMKNQFGCNPAQLKIFFGPAAKWCCYSIDKDLVQQLKEQYQNYDRFISSKADQYTFDLAHFNKAKLEQCGVKLDAFCFDYNLCTICTPRFHSYRRQKEAAGRQITMVALRR